MGKKDSQVVGYRKCACGCGNFVNIRRWALSPSKSIPKYIKGHQQYGNKRGWKGGVLHNNGYVYIYSPNHPNKNKMGFGYVKRSRLVMERHLGRILSRSEFVHHKNGVRDDDRIENLELTNLSKHQKHHQPITASRLKRDNLGRFMKGGGA